MKKEQVLKIIVKFQEEINNQALFYNQNYEESERNRGRTNNMIKTDWAKKCLGKKEAYEDVSEKIIKNLLIKPLNLTKEWSSYEQR